MPCVLLKLLSLADGSLDAHCNRYVVSYDATAHRPNGSYDGGQLLTTDDPQKAQQFASLTEALEVWKQAAGCHCHPRADGKPNRPLTAYTATVVPSPERPS